MNRTQALAQALALAVVAPDDNRAQRATALATNIASGMSEMQIARAKHMAVKLADEGVMEA